MNILRRVVLLASAFVLLAPLSFAQRREVESVNGKDAAAREILMKLRPGAPGALQRILQDEDAEAAESIGSGIAVRIKSRSKNVAALLESLSRNPNVELVEPNYILYAIAEPNDTYFSLLWGLKNTGQNIGGQTGIAGADIEAASAWELSTGSPASVVGVVDTGVAYTHPDLAGNVWSASGAFSVTIGGTTITCAAGTHGFNAITKTCDPLDDNDHGTHVSGTIGAAGNNSAGVVGVNWTASILGLKFLDKNGSGSTSDAINAIEFAVQLKESGLANVRVLSNSWGGGGFSQLLLDQIKRANASDMLFVAAAGNSGKNNDTTPHYPSSYDAPNVVAVAATDNRDALASFSNYGATSVDLGAPGVYIASTVRSGYGYMSGTSMATPHVSGAAALVLSKCALGTAALKSALLDTAEAVPSLAGKTVTGGRLNVYRAITSCGGTATPDFALSVSPASKSIKRGQTASYTVSVTGSGGFSGAVTFGMTSLPAGLSGTFTPGSVTGSGTSTLTVPTVKTTAAGTYTLTITGTSGSTIKSVGASLTVR
jgi:subtilisin family serine protease